MLTPPADRTAPQPSHAAAAPLGRLVALVLAFVAFGASAQEVPAPRFNNPYTRFGVGELTPQAYSTQLGMGGIGAAYHDPHIASPTNAAALGALRYTSFQVALSVDRSVLANETTENTTVGGNLRYLSLAFPLQNTVQRVLDGKESKWRNGMLLAIAPFSEVGYDVELIDSRAGLGEIANSFRGSGGYYRLQLGHGLEYDGRLRLGLSANYLFGRTNQQQVIGVREDESTFLGANEISDTDALRARGFELQSGLQYDFVLARREDVVRKSLTVGLRGTLGANLDGERTRLVTSRRGVATNVVDTVGFVDGVAARVELPNALGLGVFYRHTNHLSAGVDVSRVAWEGARLGGVDEGAGLRSVTRYSAGLEWTPDYQAFGKFWPRVAYRVGGYANQDPRRNVTPEYGLTFGIGIPVVRPREEVSYVNLSLNAGRFGTEGDISQRYLRLVAGFTLTDNSWFYKRRFN